MNTPINRQDAHKIIDHIFKDLLPAQGMGERAAQIAGMPDDSSSGMFHFSAT